LVFIHLSESTATCIRIANCPPFSSSLKETADGTDTEHRKHFIKAISSHKIFQRPTFTKTTGFYSEIFICSVSYYSPSTLAREVHTDLHIAVSPHWLSIPEFGEGGLCYTRLSLRRKLGFSSIKPHCSSHLRPVFDFKEVWSRAIRFIRPLGDKTLAKEGRRARIKTGGPHKRAKAYISDYDDLRPLYNDQVSRKIQPLSGGP
jgi:hypothetical protein